MELGDIFRLKGGEANLAKAAAYYERAARRGHRDAPYWLGAMCREKDHAAAWYELAATRGNRRAQTRLAEMYCAGEGVGRDLVVASFWQMAALRCEAPLYESGSVAHHKKLFAQFLWQAANQGHEEAQVRIARMPHEAKADTDSVMWMRKAALFWGELGLTVDCTRRGDS
jgi:TPR repeat protein